MNDYRVSDAEREAVIDELRRHTAAGRLTVAEFGERMDEAHAARTASQLQAALRELPRLQPQHEQSPRFLPNWWRRAPLFALLALALIVLACHHGFVLPPLALLLFAVFRPWGRHHHGSGPI